jgi:hypothetical protein
LTSLHVIEAENFFAEKIFHKKVKREFHVSRFLELFLHFSSSGARLAMKLMKTVDMFRALLRHQKQTSRRFEQLEPGSAREGELMAKHATALSASVCGILAL